MLFKPNNRTSQHLLHQAVNYLDSGKVAFVHCAICSLTSKGLVMQRTVRFTIEETTDLVFQLANTFHSSLAKLPSKLLVREPLPTGNRIHKVALYAVTGAQSDVVATLNHARAAAFTHQPFYRDSNL